MHKFRKLGLFLVSIYLVAALGCKTDVAINNPEEINIRIKKDPAKLNPVVYPSSDARIIYQQILVSLADFNPMTLKLEPILIKALPEINKITEGEYAGGVSYKMEILEEAKWDDGTAITGEDYAFTIKTVQHEKIEASGWRPFFKDLVDIKIDSSNPKSFEVIFKEPYMLAMEAIVTANVFPKHIYDPKGSTDVLGYQGKSLTEGVVLDSVFIKNFNGPVHCREIVQGAGPYRLSEWVTDQYVILEKKENYWAKNSSNPYLKAHPKKIVFKIIPDEVTAITLLRDGDLDVISSMSSANFEDLKKDGMDKFSFHTPELTRFYYLLLNNKDKILGDKQVRKALYHLTDIEQMIKNFENGYAARQNGLFHKSKSYGGNGLLIPFDPKKASEVLSNAGWKDTNGDGTLDKIIEGNKEELVLNFLISKSALSNNISLMLKEEAKKIGMEIVLNPSSNAEVRTALKNGNFQVNTARITQDPIDDDPFTKWHSQGPRNYGQFENELFDKLVEECRVTLSHDERVPLYKQMSEIINEEVPMVFLYSLSERIVLSNKIEGLITSKRPGYLANTFSNAMAFSEN